MIIEYKFDIVKMMKMSLHLSFSIIQPLNFYFGSCTCIDVVNSALTFTGATGLIQQNFNGSNTDVSFTTAVSNSFWSPLEKIQ